MKKILTFLILLSSLTIFSNIFENISFDPFFQTNFKNNTINIDLNYSDNLFKTKLNFSLQNDEKFEFVPWQDKGMFGYYYLLNEGYVDIALNEKTSLKIGQIIPKDEIESKYSLFFNSQTYIGKNSVNFKYESSNFFYKSNWILLNIYSELEFKDRAMNYKTFGIKNENLEIGYQDVILYKDRVFDPYYFLSPFPSTMIQEIRYTYSAPWVEKKEIVDDSAVVGIYGKYKSKNSEYFSQLFVDDLNFNRFINPDASQNPDKIAWSIGTKQYTKFGTFGLYNAGSTRYTFQRTNQNSQYEYTYYPSSEYNNPRYDPEIRILDYKENYIGYLYGEDSLSFLIDYSKKYKNTDNYISIEYVISDEKSPHVKWNGEETFEEGTHLLENEVLEHFIEGKIKSTIKINDFFQITPEVKINHYQNKIELVSIENTDYKIWKPIKNNNKTNFEISLKIEADIL